VKQVDQIKSKKYQTSHSQDTVGYFNAAEEVVSLTNVSLQESPTTVKNGNEETTEFVGDFDGLEEASPAESSPTSPVPNLENENLLLTPPEWEELKQPLIELLLKYYNNEEGNVELVGCIAQVIEIFCKWQQFGMINSQSLLNFMIDQIIIVIGEVKNKLIMKAIDKFDLLNSQMKSENEGAPQGPMGGAPGPASLDGSDANESAVESLSAPSAPVGPAGEDLSNQFQ